MSSTEKDTFDTFGIAFITSETDVRVPKPRVSPCVRCDTPTDLRVLIKGNRKLRRRFLTRIGLTTFEATYIVADAENQPGPSGKQDEMHVRICQPCAARYDERLKPAPLPVVPYVSKVTP